MAFKPGTIVQLKSGGPAMTVASADKDNVICIWHAEQTGLIHTTSVPVACVDELLLDDEDDLDDDD